MDDFKSASIEVAKKICIFMPSLAGGGAERVMATLANGFAARNRDVTLVLAEGSGTFRDEVDPKVDLVNLSRSHASLALPKLTAFLHRRRPDALLSGLHVANLVALLAAGIARPRMPVVVSEHSSMRHILDSRNRFRRYILEGAIRTLYPRSARVVTVSHGAARGLNDLFPGAKLSIKVIQNPVDLGNIRAHAEEKPPHQSEEPFVVAVGRLVPEKRFEDLIQAFGVVREQRPSKLVILGEGSGRGRLEALVEQLGLADAVSMPGFVKNPFPTIRRAALLVVASDREGFGNVLVEAMALGTPVVSTDCPHGPGEILEGGKWGHLVAVGAPGALATAMLDTMNARRVPSERLMARAEAFDKDYAIGSYLALLDEVVSEARQSK